MSVIGKVIAAVVLGLFVVIVGLSRVDQIRIQGTTETGLNVVSNTTSLEGYTKVQIEGQVVKQGTYTLSENDTIYDLVVLAGGLLSSADKSAINLDASISGRAYVYVPAIAGYQESCVIDDSLNKVNVNTATVSELQEVNGISSTIAQRIVTYREEYGDFETLEDLQKVLGIGSKTYEKIRDYLVLSD